jgi:hypothetical protein
MKLRAVRSNDKEQSMADFLYVFRGGTYQQLSPEQMQKHMQAWGTWIAELSNRGQFKGGDPLEAGGKQVRGKKKAIVDGPFAEAKDLVGGYLLVTADNLDAATELARGCPILEVDGSVEVRPIRKM